MSQSDVFDFSIYAMLKRMSFGSFLLSNIPRLLLNISYKHVLLWQVDERVKPDNAF